MKQGKKNIWERYLEYEIDDLDNFQIPHNKVLIEMNPKATEKTIGGILTVQEQNFPDHAVRWGIVRSVPERLICVLYDGSSMPWDCDMDIEVGDKVCMIHMDSYNAYPFTHKDKYMRLVNYSGIILALRGDKVIMCNGYILLESLKKKLKAVEYEKEVDDKDFAIVHSVGKPNRKIKSYDKKKKREVLINDSQMELNIGDKVFIEDKSRVFDLESFAHARFDNRKIYKVSSRRRIGAIIP